MEEKEALLRQRDEAKKEAAQYENQVKILLNKQRDAERHARNHRLIVHGAIMEGVFPFTASIALALLRLDTVLNVNEQINALTLCLWSFGGTGAPARYPFFYGFLCIVRAEGF